MKAYYNITIEWSGYSNINRVPSVHSIWSAVEGRFRGREVGEVKTLRVMRVKKVRKLTNGQWQEHGIALHRNDEE